MMPGLKIDVHVTAVTSAGGGQSWTALIFFGSGFIPASENTWPR